MNYRLVVVATVLSSFLLGFHLPAMHDVVEHGAPPRWDVVTVTIAFLVVTLAGSWALLRPAGRMRS